MNSDTVPSVPRVLPVEVRLIALLLLLRGAADVAGWILKRITLWQFHQHGLPVGDAGLLPFLLHLDAGIFSVQYLLRWLLLPLAGVVIGIALLRRARWALQAGAVLLLVTALYHLLFGMLGTLLVSELALHGDVLLSRLSVVVTELSVLAATLVMLYFLVAPRLWGQWDVADPSGGQVERITTGIARRLPAGTPPVAQLIALLLACWGGGMLLSTLLLFGQIPWKTDVLFAGVMSLSAMVYGLLYLTGAIGLLKCRRWAIVLAMALLALAALFPGLWALAMQLRYHDTSGFLANPQAREMARQAAIFGSLIILLRDWLVNGALIYGLLTLWRRSGTPCHELQEIR